MENYDIHYLIKKDRKCLQTKKKSRCVFAMAQFNCFEEN